MDPDEFWEKELLRVNDDVLFSCEICPVGEMTTDSVEGNLLDLLFLACELTKCFRHSIQYAP